LDDEDSLDSMVPVATQALLNRIGRHTRAVLDFQPLHVDAMGGGGAAKQVAEVAVHTAQHLVAG
jgi:hypothetical protein